MSEACNTVEMLSRVFRDTFVPVANNLLPFLLKRTVVTVKVISEAADECIKTVLIHSHLTAVTHIFATIEEGKRDTAMRFRW